MGSTLAPHSFQSNPILPFFYLSFPHQSPLQTYQSFSSYPSFFWTFILSLFCNNLISTGFFSFFVCWAHWQSAVSYNISNCTGMHHFRSVYESRSFIIFWKPQNFIALGAVRCYIESLSVMKSCTTDWLAPRITIGSFWRTFYLEPGCPHSSSKQRFVWDIGEA